MPYTWAQAVESLGGSSTILSMLLSGALIVTATGVYRFVVNFRNTERGMNRKRMQDATRNERTAQREAALWQGRCGDLEYILRKNGIPVPPLDRDLQTLVDAQPSPDVRLPDDPPIEPGSNV